MWLREYFDRVLHLIFKSDIEYAEFQSCCMACVWGVWLVFNRLDDSNECGVFVPSTVSALRTLFPGYVWSIWFCFVGVGHYVSLVRMSYASRRFFSFVALCTWLYVSVYLGMTNPRMVAVPTTFFFALGSAWGHWRLRSNKSKSTD